MSTAARHAKSHAGKGSHKPAGEVSAKVEDIFPVGSWQRMTAGVAAAAGGGLLAAAVVGVGPAALAGAAGYLAYRAMNKEAGASGHKH